MALGPFRIDRRGLLGGLAATVLPLPTVAALAQSVVTSDGFTVLVAKPGRLRLRPAPADETAIWGYGGALPAPVLRIRKGDEVKVRLVNSLPQPTSLSWHGVRIANAMDGVAGLTQAPVPPGGGTFEYRFTPPDAGLFWYHPHAWPHVAEQVERGLYGVLIVDELAPPAVDEDILLVLDDWSLDAQGKLDTEGQGNSKGQSEPVGSLVTVNAQPMPATKTMRPGARLRLRLLNVCADRIAVVAVEGATATVIAIDGQPSEMFEPAQGRVPIGPGSRFELLVDLPKAVRQQVALILRGDGEPDRPLMLIKTAGVASQDHLTVTKLPDNPLLPTRIPLERSARHEIVIGPSVDVSNPKPSPKGQGAPWRWTINGTGTDGTSGKPLFAVKRGSAVTLTFVNKTTVAQQMHVHGHVWRLLHDLDDGWDPYWRDSVLLGPGKTKHVAFIADNPGKWVLASSMLDRQGRGLAGWFAVI
jgi:FtsP/CotA-like multicopper oxidase with cupredoxin domain